MPAEKQPSHKNIKRYRSSVNQPIKFLMWPKQQTTANSHISYIIIISANICDLCSYVSYISYSGNLQNTRSQGLRVIFAEQ